jgi:hypothetical protein
MDAGGGQAPLPTSPRSNETPGSNETPPFKNESRFVSNEACDERHEPRSLRED